MPGLITMRLEDFKAKLFNNEHLPAGIVVKGSLYLRGYAFKTHLPEGLVVKGFLELSGCTSLTRLPAGLVINGWLSLRGCTSLTHLPEGLVVNGWLSLRECTSLTHLPAGLVVKGEIYCDEDIIDSIPYEDLPLYINFNFEDLIHEYFTKRLQGEAA